MDSIPAFFAVWSLGFVIGWKYRMIRNAFLAA